ncbi:MAG: hypothetical protein Q7K44_03885 [Candidatus Liptonbacteria bacterium]|nr:hypothetical protein [Candidatus Liptonbacteria bacterium]
MLQNILQSVVAGFHRIKNLYTVVEVKSMNEFLKFVRNEKNPRIYIFLSWMNYNKQNSECVLCGIKFTSFLEDGRAIVLKLREDVRIFGRMARDRKKMKQYINIRLLNESVKPPVQIFFALMPSIEIEVRDLYGKLVNPNELKKELF